MKIYQGVVSLANKEYERISYIITVLKEKNIKNVTRCRDSGSAKSIETR